MSILRRRAAFLDITHPTRTPGSPYALDRESVETEFSYPSDSTGGGVGSSGWKRGVKTSSLKMAMLNLLANATTSSRKDLGEVVPIGLFGLLGTSGVE